MKKSKTPVEITVDADCIHDLRRQADKLRKRADEMDRIADELEDVRTTIDITATAL